MKTLLKGVLIGVMVTLLGLSVYSTARYCFVMPAPSQQALDQSLQPMQVPPEWIKSGTPVFRYTQYAVSPDGRSSTGVWSCEGPSTFEWQFGVDETVHVLDGRVEVDYLGQHFALEPGDSAFFQAETRAVWHVPRSMRKSFTLHHPNLAVRLVRRALRALDLD
jgi:uncharacterized cupin superfamily protein